MSLNNLDNISALRADAIWANTGEVGCLLLLKQIPVTSTATHININTGEITTIYPHGLLLGSRIKFSSTSVLPVPLTLVEYFAIVTGLTTFKIASSLIRCISNTSVILTTLGEGVLSIEEQIMSAADSIVNLLTKEIIDPGYSRKVIRDLGAATKNSNGGNKLTKLITFNNNGATDIEYTHYLLASTSNLSNSTDLELCLVRSEPVLQTIPIGLSLTIPIDLKVFPVIVAPQQILLRLSTLIPIASRILGLKARLPFTDDTVVPPVVLPHSCRPVPSFSEIDPNYIFTLNAIGDQLYYNVYLGNLSSQNLMYINGQPLVSTLTVGGNFNDVIFTGSQQVLEPGDINSNLYLVILGGKGNNQIISGGINALVQITPVDDPFGTELHTASDYTLLQRGRGTVSKIWCRTKPLDYDALGNLSYWNSNLINLGSVYAGCYYIGENDNDFVEILNFDKQYDRIVLVGSPSDYSITNEDGLSKLYLEPEHDLVAKICTAKRYIPIESTTDIIFQYQFLPNPRVGTNAPPAT